MKNKQILRIMISSLLSMSIILTMTPNVYASTVAIGENEECIEEVLQSEETEANSEDVDIADDLDIIEATENIENVETVETIDDSVIDKKIKLSEMVAYLKTATEGVDYAADIVYASVNSLEEAQKVAEFYKAEILNCDNGYAVFKLSDDLNVIEAIELAADTENSSPVIYPNLISKSCMTKAKASDSSDNSRYETASSCNSNDLKATPGNTLEIDVSNEKPLTTVCSVTSNLFDPYISENAIQGTYNSYQWHHEVIGSQYAWINGIKGKNVNIAIIAEGINTSHIDAPVNIIASRTYVNGSASSDTSSIDETGYGTAMAGLISAPENGSLGMGIAPEANIINIKTDASIPSLISAIKYAKGADIIVLDAVFDMPLDDLEDAINIVHESGSAVFTASGNTGGSYEVYPAAFENAICIGGTDKCNQRAGEYSYSNSIDIAVPGVELWTCSSNDNNLYESYTGNVLLSSVAAGEAALILEKAKKKEIKSFLDSDNNLLQGNKKADALLKYMQASTIKAGTGTGSGIVYLPKALKMDSVASTPSAPIITFDAVTSTTVKLHFRADALTSAIYYTVDGKKPTYKNGEASVNSRYIYGNFSDVDTVDTTNITKDVLTINAIAVNPFGIVSKVSTCNIPLTGYADSVSVSGPDSVLAGKTAPFTAFVVPSNSKTKKVKWHVEYSGDENLAKTNGVTISTSGSLKASKAAVSGTYHVWAETVVSGRVSSKVAIKVKDTQVIKSIKPDSARVTENIGYPPVICDVTSLFKVEKIDGTNATLSDVVYTSSNSSIAEVSADKLLINKAGSVVITATAADGSGIKATCTVNIIQKVTGLFFNSNGYDKVAAGKSISLQTIIVPDNSSIRKITNWYIDANGEANGIKVNNGKVTTSKTTNPGSYVVTAEVVDIDGTKISTSYTIEVIKDAITKITVPKTINVFRTENNFSAKDFAEMNVDIEGGERDEYGKCVYGAVKVTYPAGNILNTMYGPLTPDGDGYILPVKASGKATGKAKITFEAMDGSGKKATCTVNVINPASSVKVAPASLNVSALTAGKTTNFKAIFGTEYGAVSDKKVKWSIIDGASVASISQTGALKIDANTSNYTAVRIRATAKDGSGAYGDCTMRIFKNPGKLEISDAAGNVVNPPKNVQKGFMKSFYVKVPRKDTAYEKIIDGHYYGDWKLSSSNPANATIRRNKGTAVIIKPNYYLYYFEVLGIKKGSSKLTVTTPDGSQSISIDIKVE